jgi:hypothetical protein
MDFLKKNYEKLLLGIVLVGLIGALGFLPFFISAQKQSLEDKKNSVRPVNVKPLTNISLMVSEAALKRAASPAMIDFGPPNRLFNPMPWQRAADGHLIPVAKVGPTALLLTNVRPMYLTLTLESVNTDVSGAPTYIITMEKPANTGVGKSRNQYSCTPTAKNKVFSVVEVKGKPEDPTELILMMEDTKERAVVSKTKPFERIEGYMADLRYDPEKKKWDNCRANSRISPPLAFNGEEYNVVTLNKDEIVLSAKSNGKKWPIKANPSP